MRSEWQRGERKAESRQARAERRSAVCGGRKAPHLDPCASMIGLRHQCWKVRSRLGHLRVPPNTGSVFCWPIDSFWGHAVISGAHACANSPRLPIMARSSPQFHPGDDLVSTSGIAADRGSRDRTQPPVSTDKLDIVQHALCNAGQLLPRILRSRHCRSRSRQSGSTWLRLRPGRALRPACLSCDQSLTPGVSG